MARPKTPIISIERAARAALDVIDTGGLEGLALSRVSDRLGVKAPSLYYHFKDKDALLSEVARLLLTDYPLPPLRRGIDWREAIVDVSLASWRSILRHPRAAPLLLSFFPRHLLINAYEHWARLLTLNGLPTAWHLRVLEGAERLTFGSALFAAASRSREVPPFPSYDTQRHPHLTNAIRANPFDQEGTFVEALRSFLRGIPDGAAQNETDLPPGDPAAFPVKRQALPLRRKNSPLGLRGDHDKLID